MATAQLNVRIDADLKAGGDAVLERFGVPAVQVIRDAWQYMVDNQKLPEFCAKRAENVTGQNEALLISESGAGMASRLAREAGIIAEFDSMTYEQIRETAYEEMLIEQEERRVQDARRIQEACDA